MENIMILLINLTVSGSLIALVIFFINKIFKDKIHYRFKYYMWFAVLIKLFIPISIIVNSYNIFSIFNSKFLNQKNNSIIGTKIDNGYNMNINTVNDFGLNIINDGAINMNQIFVLVWVIIGIIFIIHTIFINYKMYKHYKESRIINSDGFNEILDECKCILNIKSDVKIYESDKFYSPVIFGILKPKIIFPENLINKLEKQDLKYIFLHELNHFKSKDILVNTLFSIVQILHWFNPIVWVVFRTFKKEQEVFCDLRVLENIKNNEYAKYGNTIIKLIENLKNNRYNTIPGFFNNKNNIFNRIKMINKYRNGTTGLFFKIIFIMLFISVLFFNADIYSFTSNNVELPENVLYENYDKYFGIYDGSFVLYDTNNNIYVIHDKENAVKRVPPISTYKIYHALIGLETDVIKDENTYFDWNGQRTQYEEWNRSHNLKTAMAYSVNWYFEEISKKINKEIYELYFNKINYGNRNVQEFNDDFWTAGNLKISPLEQVDKLIDFYNNDLQFDKRNIDIVKKTILLDTSQGNFYGKTGTNIVNDQAVNGWFVGFWELNNNVYYFAVFIKNGEDASGASAKKITTNIINNYIRSK